MQEKPIICIDGGAGGSQVVRLGYALAALAQQPLRITNIRASSKPPGLKQQHVKGIQLISGVCGGRLEGAYSGSSECLLLPSYFKDNHLVVDSEGAGSCTLLAQMALPCLLFTPGPSGFTGKGGTDVSLSCPIDEMCGNLMPILSKFGIDAQLTLVRRGFHPKGGGEIQLFVEMPLCNSGLRTVTMLEQGTLTNVKGRAFASGDQEAKDMEKMVAAAKEMLQALVPTVPVQIQEVVETSDSAVGNACGLTLVAITDTGCRYGTTYFRDFRDTLPPDECGRKAVEKLAAEVRSGGCVDSYTQEQLIIFMALANGRSEIRVGQVTKHTKAAIMITEALLPCRFKINPDGETNIIQCDGVRLVAPGRFTAAGAVPKKIRALPVHPACLTQRPPTPPGKDNPSAVPSGQLGQVESSERSVSPIEDRDGLGDECAAAALTQRMPPPMVSVPSTQYTSSYNETASERAPPSDEPGTLKSGFGNMFLAAAQAALDGPPSPRESRGSGPMVSAFHSVLKIPLEQDTPPSPTGPPPVASGFASLFQASSGGFPGFPGSTSHDQPPWQPQLRQPDSMPFQQGQPQFANDRSTVTPSSAFGSFPQAPVSSAFGGAAVSNAVPSASVFNQPPPSHGSAFGFQSNGLSPFGNAPSTESVFGARSEASFNTPSPFGSHAPPSVGTASPFMAAAPPVGGSVFTSAPVPPPGNPFLSSAQGMGSSSFGTTFAPPTATPFIGMAPPAFQPPAGARWPPSGAEEGEMQMDD